MNDNTNTRVKIGEVRLSYCHLFTPEAISDVDIQEIPLLARDGSCLVIMVRIVVRRPAS